MTWLCVFDTETTGVDVLEDRLVTAYIALMDEKGHIRREQRFVVDPGIPIPEGAAAVHGFTTKRVKAEATHDPHRAIHELHYIINEACAEGGMPLVGANLAYDCSLLESERRRHCPEMSPVRYHQVGDPAGTESVKVFDTYVADKMVDRYRKGSRKLIDTARHYGVDLDESQAHEASFDAIAAGRIALKLLRQDPFNVGDFAVIHEGLALAKAEQAASLEQYFRKSGKTEPDGSPIVCDQGWPLHSALTINQDPRDIQSHANLAKEAA